MKVITAILLLGCLAVAMCTEPVSGAAALEAPPPVTLSIVGTSDLHGAAFPRDGVGGLALFAGYVNNLRAARAADHGAVLLVDSGDTFQGGVESNLSEGALVVDAFNAMGYAAEAIGNHDFDFGSPDSTAGRQLPGDLRGAIKARAVQARYPFLAANLIDEATGRPVEWPNVRPSILVDAAGLKVGLVGVMTIDALRSTIAANVGGLRVAPLAPAIAAEAAKLRAAGAAVVIVAAHAGGRCDRFDRPVDLSSCDSDSEIFEVARRLPAALVDVIAAGHTHGGLAHEVAGIAIVQPFSRGQAFDRVDLVLDRGSRKIVRAQVFAPRRICAWEDPVTGSCVAAAASARPAEYEGHHVAADPAVVRAMEPALQRVRALQATPLGVSLDRPIGRGDAAGSPLGNLFAEALRDGAAGADVAVVNSATRGLWADLPAGPMTFGRLYDMFPFDNRVRRIRVTGAELGRWIGNEIAQGRRSGLGLAGLSVTASCQRGTLQIDLARDDGRAVRDDDRLLAVTIGAPTLSGGLASTDPLGAAETERDAAVVREVVEEWVRRLGRAPDHRIDELAHRTRTSAVSEIAACAAVERR